MTKELVKEMYAILASSSAELENLEDIVDKISRSEKGKDNFQQLTMMSTDIRQFRVKFSKMTKSLFDREFNVVELAKKQRRQ